MRRILFAVVPSLSIAFLFAACGGGTGGVGAASDADGGAPGDTDGSITTGDDATTTADGGTTVDGSTTADGSLIDSGVDSGRFKDAGKDANNPLCPKTYGVVPGNCAPVGLQCTYDQGRCECLGYCGGPPPMPGVDYSHWGCTPRRVDGCPDARPVAGGACKTPGQACTYGNCCVQTFTCTGAVGAATWSSGGLLCPP